MARSTRAQWVDRVRRWEASGLTGREFASHEGVNLGALGWWKSKLRRDAQEPAAFIEVVAAPRQEAEGRIEVVVREAVRIRVAGAFDADVLRRAVAAFEAP